MRDIGSSPTGDHITLASFASFKEAEETVDLLAEKNFPVQFVSIVADGLHAVEVPASHFMWLKTLGIGIIGGTLIGAANALTFAILGYSNPTIELQNTVAYGIMAGGLSGAVVGILLYTMFRPRADLSNQNSFVAKYYDIRVHEQYAERAKRTISDKFPSLSSDRNKLEYRSNPANRILTPQAET